MAKKKQSPLVYNPDVRELNKFFYTRYDENFLFNKAIVLSSIVENEPRFKLQMAEDQSQSH
jgi:hypothetical protein